MLERVILADATDARRPARRGSFAMFFDGRPAGLAEMDVEIAPGYEVR